jgi:flagellar basal-body rod protein FlgF
MARRADDTGHMDRGLYIAASGMLAEQVRQDQIANDLANASTPGYKADRTAQQSFGNLLLDNSLTGQQIGPQSTAVQVRRIATNWTPEPLTDTGEPLDFGITGNGFFAVQTAQGTRYTRNGQFTSDAQGRLVSAQGDPVLGRNGQPIRIGADGRVDPRLLNVVLLNNPRKQGDNYVTGTPGAVAGQTAGQVRAGALEGSGADPTRSMVDMISSMRSYESGQKVIQTIDETLQKAVSQVGNVTGA